MQSSLILFLIVECGLDLVMTIAELHGKSGLVIDCLELRTLIS